MSVRYDNTPRTFANGFLFGIPLKGLGWFASLLMSAASGFAAFFAATFLGIVFILFHNTNGRSPLDYADSYRRLGLPVGALVGILVLGYLGMLWVRRKAGRI